MIRKLVPCAVLLFAALACGQGAPTDNGGAAPTPEAGGVVKGYGLSPLGFPDDYSKFSDFLREIGSLPNGGVMFNGAWRDDAVGGSDAGQIPGPAAAVMEQAAVYGYTPIIVFGWRSDTTLLLSVPGDATNEWSNQEAQRLFEQTLIAFAETYHPPYLFLGNESDAYYVTNSEDYAHWIEFYNRAYDAIKAVSPETQVGPSFQYERMSGKGALNGWTAPAWGALDAHDLSRVDIVGITLYPWLSVSAPEDVPDDYLAPLLERIGDKPLAITETGWPGADLGLAAPWAQSAEAQVRYIDALRRLLEGVNVRILNWLHYYQMAPSDANFWKEFSSISLIDYEGNKRPVYDAWLTFQP